MSIVPPVETIPRRIENHNSKCGQPRNYNKHQKARELYDARLLRVIGLD